MRGIWTKVLIKQEIRRAVVWVTYPIPKLKVSYWRWRVTMNWTKFGFDSTHLDAFLGHLSLTLLILPKWTVTCSHFHIGKLRSQSKFHWRPKITFKSKLRYFVLENCFGRHKFNGNYWSILKNNHRDLRAGILALLTVNPTEVESVLKNCKI